MKLYSSSIPLQSSAPFSASSFRFSCSPARLRAPPLRSSFRPSPSSFVLLLLSPAPPPLHSVQDPHPQHTQGSATARILKSSTHHHRPSSNSAPPPPDTPTLPLLRHRPPYTYRRLCTPTPTLLQQHAPSPAPSPPPFQLLRQVTHIFSPTSHSLPIPHFSSTGSEKLAHTEIANSALSPFSSASPRVFPLIFPTPPVFPRSEKHFRTLTPRT